MPIYEYRCEQCRHEFEELVGFNEAPPHCPKCGAEKVDRLLSTPQFSLKGDGWYSDHYGLKKSDKDSGSTEQKTDSSTKEGDE